MKLPGLGDSVSEGTIVEWSVAVGQRVEVDDVVAVIETDKVTIDIKAETAGVITTLFAGADENLMVGDDLYALDTEGVATAAAPAAAAAPTAATPPPAAVPQIAAAQEASPRRGHVPLIKFLGKRSLLKAAAPAAAGAALRGLNLPAGPAWPAVEHTTGAKDFTEVPRQAFFGRPLITEQELESVHLGCLPDDPVLG